MTVEERGATIEEVRAEETRSFDSVVARRNVGLRIVVGVVAFDLIILKIALEASGQMAHQTGLTWAVRAIVAFAFLALAGMLIQIEHRNRDDRREYRNATARVRAIRRSENPAAIETPEESFMHTVRRSWATTWPLLGTLALTVSIWVIVGLLFTVEDAGIGPHRPARMSVVPKRSPVAEGTVNASRGHLPVP